MNISDFQGSVTDFLGNTVDVQRNVAHVQGSMVDFFREYGRFSNDHTVTTKE